MFMVWKLIHAVLNGKSTFQNNYDFLFSLRNKIILENNYEYTTISSLRENKVIHLITQQN